MKTKLGGLKTRGRQLLAKLLQASKESFTVKEAADILNVSRYRAATLLALWAKNGWLYRIRRGLYIPVSLESRTPETSPEEPWLIAHKLFSPCYIGGWTAAHHWGFTEQLFNTIFVMTTKKVHKRDQPLHGVTFKIKTILPIKNFGVLYIWSGKVKIAISDPTKTIIDGLNDPSVLGGIRMVADILLAYIHSKEFNQDKLVQYANMMGNSAIYKRLGFLISQMNNKRMSALVLICKNNLKSGHSQLDPTTPGDRLATQWHLWVPKLFTIQDPS